MRRNPALDVTLILLVIFVWLALLVQSVTTETRLERGYMLDNTGTPVEVYYNGAKR
jgi:hypothetical protein